MSKIKLEVGKSYRTREEGKVVIKSYVGRHIAYPKWRSESIKAMGNAVVPQVVLQIFKAIQRYEDTL